MDIDELIILLKHELEKFELLNFEYEIHEDLCNSVIAFYSAK